MYHKVYIVVNNDLQNYRLIFDLHNVKYVLQVVILMNDLGKLLKKLRGKESLRDASERIKISHTYLDTIEKGYDKRSGKPVNPTPETLRLISQAYNYPYEELMKMAGYLENSNDLPELTKKDERDIAKDLEKIINNLNANDGYSQFDGQVIEDMSEEDRELLIASLENSMRLAKRLAKQKFTPKKHRQQE